VTAQRAVDGEGP